MKLALTPSRLAATYECLRAFPPFCNWKLPPASEVKFRITQHADREGHYTRYVGTTQHIIAVSSKNIGHFNSLAAVTAHEMIHLKQGVAKTETPNTQHNAEFRRHAERICRQFGWDPKTFM